MPTVTEAIHWLGLDFPALTGNRLYWPFLVSALVIGLAYQHWRQLPGFLNKAIWWHPSARQDYALFMLLNIFKLGVLTLVLPEIGQFIWWGLILWQDWFGYQSKQPASSSVNISFTLCLFIASDFSRYWLHRWMHQSRWLWPIHRLHHTAQALTPITFYRIHPLESLLFGLRYALVTGLITSLYMHWFGFGLQAQQWLGSLIFVAL
ncbi:MAG: sterol desaturase family protein, partial [Gammaproteobacteria bacterium]|nr:sterol desaturase family protein [Gammaproteobacteria bacterium]